MRKVKYFIPLFILFLTIGFATVNQTLSIKGTVTNESNIDDFTVYFSDVLVNDIQDLTLVKNENELVFTTTLEELGNQYKITYDITNGSKYFDAAFTVSCTQSNNYLKVTNELDISNLAALETRTGNLTLEKTQTNAAETNTKHTVTCTITATPVERESTAVGEAADAVEKTYVIGEKITIGTESFNVISQTDNKITMYAQFNLNTSYRQSQTENLVSFSTSTGWTASPGPKEIDIQSYAGNAQTYVNEYVAYIRSQTNDTTVSGNLISIAELVNLGCSASTDYSATGTFTCTTSEYTSWIINNQNVWTRSTSPSYSNGIWILGPTGNFPLSGYTNSHAGIRPTITISKETLKKIYSSKK